MTTNQPVPRIPARQWLKEHNEAQRKQEEELMLAQERERARVIHRASDMVDAFMTKVVEEKDPWGKAEELDMGSEEECVIRAAMLELKDLGYVSQIRHPTYVGPGGLCEVQSSWTNEKVWNLYIQRPR